MRTHRFAIALALLATTTACNEGSHEDKTQTEMNTQAQARGRDGSTGDRPATIGAGQVPASGSTAGGSGGQTTRAQAGGDVNLPADDALPDGAIVGILSASNRAEVEQGELAVQRARNPEVKRFAELMVREHASMLRDGGAAPAGAEPSTEEANMRAVHQETMTRLRNANGAAFDRAYLAAQVDAHQSTLETLRLLQNEASSSTLKDKVSKAIPVVEQHLREAERLRRAVGEAPGGNRR